MVKITEFAIHGLYGHRDITIPIRDNRIVLVGVNGLGKTTIINLLYFFLSRQWKRISEYDFSKITLKIEGKEITISQQDVKSSLLINQNLSRKLPSRFVTRIESNPEILELLAKESLSINEKRDLQKILRMPLSIIEKIHADYRDNYDDTLEISQDLRKVEKSLKTHLEGQILYLPTYRRIEKELGTIFPVLDEYVDRYDDNLRIHNSRGTEFIELIEFGMRDVDQKISYALSAIKENARTELNNLAGSYLRDVIRREANSFDKNLIKELNDETISKILNRVEERTLSTEDKNTLRNVIKKIKIDSKETISEQDKYLAHFFAQLVYIHNALREQESAITQFIDVCNRYLEGKYFYYNEKDYKLEIKLDNERPLELSMLSSGEKQIVSLFSHLYLSGEKQYLILLDEPELSLSVEWQKHFLPDILASKRCMFLATVTHSPFIFDNELDDYAADIKDYIKDI
jgi:predicted ATP-binding protein involved in virulence